MEEEEEPPVEDKRSPNASPRLDVPANADSDEIAGGAVRDRPDIGDAV